uniref:Gla domain-containing protein n=1 Tax=Chrysemys picta bellii TaxID=8478 RepID=A0A8C3FEU2_CHRPI
MHWEVRWGGTVIRDSRCSISRGHSSIWTIGGQPQSSNLLFYSPMAGVKVKRETANAFVRRQKRSYPYYERYYEMYKSPMELRKEQCENYAPCDYLSDHVGFHAAYQRYFGRF